MVWWQARPQHLGVTTLVCCHERVLTQILTFLFRWSLCHLCCPFFSLFRANMQLFALTLCPEAVEWLRVP